MWNKAHQTAYEVLIARFKQRTLLQYFEMDAQALLFTDAHKTGLGAMLAQGDSFENAKPVAIASRTTNTSEQKYPQIDLEALAIDFALRRFRHYIVGFPTKIQVITDHQPLCSIFNGKRQGSIRTERIKLRHQDIRFTVTYQRGKINQSDYLPRHAKPIEKLTREEQQEADELNNLLYMLLTTPIIDCMGIGTIAQATKNDPTLTKLSSTRGQPGSQKQNRKKFNASRTYCLSLPSPQMVLWQMVKRLSSQTASKTQLSYWHTELHILAKVDLRDDSDITFSFTTWERKSKTSSKRATTAVCLSTKRQKNPSSHTAFPRNVGIPYQLTCLARCQHQNMWSLYKTWHQDSQQQN